MAGSSFQTAGPVDVEVRMHGRPHSRWKSPFRRCFSFVMLPVSARVRRARYSPSVLPLPWESPRITDNLRNTKFPFPPCPVAHHVNKMTASENYDLFPENILYIIRWYVNADAVFPCGSPALARAKCAKLQQISLSPKERTC